MTQSNPSGSAAGLVSQPPVAVVRFPFARPKTLNPNSAEAARLLTLAVRNAEAVTHRVDRLIEAAAQEEAKKVTIEATREAREAERAIEIPSRRPEAPSVPTPSSFALVDPDFPFDESQLRFIEGLATHQFVCGTGAAGTGKTTCTKAVVQRLLQEDRLSRINLKNYWKQSGESAEGAEDDDPEYQSALARTVGSGVPSVVMCAFTGQATQMVRKNFPESWHANIMTIHRMLGFVPEYYDSVDPETGTFAKKRRFVPTYDSSNKLPWSTIVIDEAGMLGLDLWKQLIAACRQDTQIIMIGDINQLPPVHGQSIFGFAMTHWPTYELTKAHRSNNRIVDAAWHILEGKIPPSDGPRSLHVEDNDGILETLKFIARQPDWKVLTVRLPQDTNKASRNIRTVLTQLAKKTDIYVPNRDVIITPINGLDSSNGYELGQLPLNRELVLKLNPESPRYLIDAGREKKQFAVGDKVMATKNDHEIGVTNGMIGIIEEIVENGTYGGDRLHFGLLSEIQERNRALGEGDQTAFMDLKSAPVDLDSLMDELAAKDEEVKDKLTDSIDRGPSSHFVTVRFPHRSVIFRTLAEVYSLQHAYAVTCHKMQGGEASLCVSILHHAHGSMLNREWAYTAITRSKDRHIIFYTTPGLKSMLLKQKIKGKTLAEKTRVFASLSAKKLKDVYLPAPKRIG